MCTESSRVYELNTVIGNLEQELQQYKDKLEIAVETLEFYSDINNWRRQHQICWTLTSKEDVQFNETVQFGGKKARQALSKIKEVKSEKDL